MANEKIKLEDIDFEQIKTDLNQNKGQSTNFDNLIKYCAGNPYIKKLELKQKYLKHTLVKKEQAYYYYDELKKDGFDYSISIYANKPELDREPKNINIKLLDSQLIQLDSRDNSHLAKDFEENFNTIISELKKLTGEEVSETPKNTSDSEGEKHGVSKNTILYGPPGTGKTYNTVNYVAAIIENNEAYRKAAEASDKDAKFDDKDLATLHKEAIDCYNKYKDKGRIEFVTFHQSYGYEDFIIGIKPQTSDNNIAYKVEPGVFVKFCDKARNDTINNNYVFIIDEINRGNISKIFGELITTIEESRREGGNDEIEVTLPYEYTNKNGENKFSVPNNVYILGTMNTADRSIALLDTALRRRFDFVEMMPKPELLKDIEIQGEPGEETDPKLGLEKMLETINKRITVLLDREHTIGHAYFMDLKDDPTITKLANIFKNKIIPLLQEYFYDDYEKIRFVLGDDKKAETNQFIIKINDEEYSFDDETKPIYKLNYESAFDKIKSYTGIYEKKPEESK